MMLCVGTLTLTIKIQRSWASTPLSAVVIPHGFFELFGGQSQLFNSNVTGGSPPYTYQWWLDSDPISGATNPTFNFTVPLSPGGAWDLNVMVNDSAGGWCWSWPGAFILEPDWEPIFHEPVYFSVEPVPTAPLINVNASINGLETLPAQSPVGDTFTVEIHLRNATAINAPYGVAGVEVHFYFGNILNYCKPIGFVDELGQPDGALAGPCIYALKGFYDDNWNPVTTPPYTNATQYLVAAGSETGPWNGNDGLVAIITFQITGQPSQNMSQPDFYAPLQIVFGDLNDVNASGVGVSGAQGTLRIDAAPSLVGDLNGDGKVSLQDLALMAQAYGSKPGDPNWNPLADIAPPYGVIGLTDLVTLATHYGQQSP